MTAGEVKFSDAISWIVVFCRSTSRRTISASSGSAAASGSGTELTRRVPLGEAGDGPTSLPPGPALPSGLGVRGRGRRRARGAPQHRGTEVVQLLEVALRLRSH